MGLGAADYDRDGWLDLVKTNFDDDTPSLYRNLGGGAFEDATRAGGLGTNTRYLGWGIGFVDFDLDSWPDIFIVNGHVYPEADRVGGRYSYEQRKLLYRNLGNGRFEDVSDGPAPACSRRQSARGAAVGDLFNTGTAGHRRQQHAQRPDAAPQLRAVPGHSLRAAARGHALEPQRDRRARDGARGHAPADRRGAQRRQLLVAERSAAARRARRRAPGRPRRGRVAGRHHRGRSTGVDADQLVVIREGSGVVRRQPDCAARAACAGDGGVAPAARWSGSGRRCHTQGIGSKLQSRLRRSEP